MPLYKYVGNRILTPLREQDAGHRAERVPFRLPRLQRRGSVSRSTFDGNSDGFDFDTQIIIQLIDAGKRIVEVPIPTYYGDEICYVDGLKYARDVSVAVLRYRLAKLGFAAGEFGGVGEEYLLNDGEESSHAIILRWLAQMPPARILDLGCSGGLLSERIRAAWPHGDRR